VRDRLLATATTVAGMNRRQLAGVARRKVRSELRPRIGAPVDERYEPAGPPPELATDSLEANAALLRRSASEGTQAHADRRSELLAGGTVSFLNGRVTAGERAPFDLDPRAGERSGFPILWSLKLWSFAPVRWLVLGSREPDPAVTSMLLSWLAAWDESEVTDLDRPGYLRGYWTPYAVSRRVDNLSRLAALPSVRGRDRERLATRIARNVRFLAAHVEYDIGGNHLIENGCALVVGGVATDDEAAARQGVAVLREELPGQLLEGGLHFERSPMYHTILLYRVAAALDLLRRSGRPVPSALRSCVDRMYGWLARCAPEAADFPLLNDAVYHEGPSRTTCLRTVEAVFDEPGPVERAPLRSSYYSLRAGEVMALVDGGRPCPPQLPAHAHNDVASVVAWVGGEPLFVDTGVYNYEAGPRRRYARGVAAHNTVQVGDLDQAVTTGKYMMGPRLDPTAKATDDGTGERVAVTYDAPRPRPKYRHERVVSLDGQRLRVDDRVASDLGTATSRLHLHPELSVEAWDRTDEADALVLTKPGLDRVRVSVRGAETVDVARTPYFPEYGAAREQPTLRAVFDPSADPDDASLSHVVTVGDD
jgi:uncharacterized heparinase superfamily protein